MQCPSTMTPKIRQVWGDVVDMTFKFPPRRRATATCTHDTQMRIEVAGLSREVCEACGKVSVGFVEHHYAEDVDDAATSTDD